jgi:acetolactate synthase-1/2/3 large subunit
MKVYEAMARALVDNDVTTLFGVMGDGNLYFVDSFVREAGGKYVASDHEAGAALMALGYATVSRRIGAATVTHGPGLTNTMTALIDGVKGQLPMLLICGDTATLDPENLQNVAQRELIVATGAGFVQARGPATIVQDVATALRRAFHERRPVALNVPIEFQHQEIDYEPVRVTFQDSRAHVPMSTDLEDAIGILAAARRPLILAGRGAVSDEARAALIALAERLEAPLVTTLKARDLFRGEDFNLGIMGTLSTPPAVDAIIQSDCVLSFGASLNKWTTSNGSFLAGKRVIQCNLEPSEIGRFAAPLVGLVGDPALVAVSIQHWLDEAEIPGSGFRSDALKQAIAGYSPATDFEDLSTETTIDVRVAFARFDEAIPADRVFVTDGGRFVSQALKMIAVQDPSSFVFTLHFGSIGLGMSYAIGAGQAAPDRPVLLVIGDGGFMLGGLTELHTAVRQKSDLIIILCNDGGYGAEHIQFRNKDMDPALSLFDWPDFATVADALGAKGITVRNRADLEAAVTAIAHRTTPVLIDLKCDPNLMPAGAAHR